MTTPNAELAYRILDHIDAHPEQWDQGAWMRKVGDCGTAGCFAGWVAVLSGEQIRWDPALGDPPYAIYVERSGGSYISDVAEELLGASRYVWNGEDEEDLFDSYNTREDLGRLVEEIFGPRPDGAA